MTLRIRKGRLSFWRYNIEMMKDYKALFDNLMRICLFKASPKDLPDSSNLNIQLLVLYFISGVVLLSSGAALGVAVVEALLEVILLIGFIYVVLTFFNAPFRFNQTLAALLGTGIIFTSLSTPFVYINNASRQAENSAGIEGLFLLILFGWSVVVMVKILAEAINKPALFSGLITFCYLYLSYQIINAIYPAIT